MNRKSFSEPPKTAFDIRMAGNGPRRTSMWLDGVACIVEGFHEWPEVGTSRVRVRAKDEWLHLSDWSDSLRVFVVAQTHILRPLAVAYILEPDLELELCVGRD